MYHLHFFSETIQALVEFYLGLWTLIVFDNHLNDS